MKQLGFVLVLLLCVACGGSDGPVTSDAGQNPGTNPPNNPPNDPPSDPPGITAREVLQDFFQNNLPDISGLLALFQGFLSGEQEVPPPSFDFLSALRNGGKLPWTWDLDADGTDDLGGEIYFTDPSGSLVQPFNLLDLLSGAIQSPLDLLDNLADGTTMHLSMEFTSLPLSENDTASGEGNLQFKLNGGVPEEISGHGFLEIADASFEFDFDDIGLSTDGYPIADLSFELSVDEHVIKGSIALDGTSEAVVRARIDDQAEEVYRIDLDTGQPIP